MLLYSSFNLTPQNYTQEKRHASVLATDTGNQTYTGHKKHGDTNSCFVDN